MEYRVNPNAVYVEVCDEYLLAAVGEARGKLPQLRKLSESGAFIWRGLEKGLASESIICAVMQEYEISRDEAQSGFAASVPKQTDCCQFSSAKSVENLKFLHYDAFAWFFR